MGEGLVGLRHPVHVVFTLERAALLVGGVEDLAGQLLEGMLLAPLAGEREEPAHGERAGAPLRDLDRHLVVRAADAARAHLEHRCHRLDGALEHLDRVLAGLLPDGLERLVHDVLGDRLLALLHHAVHDLGDEHGLVDGVTQQGARGDLGATRHYELLVAPYFERACLRSLTAEVSSAARMTWERTPGRSVTRPPRMRTTE